MDIADIVVASMEEKETQGSEMWSGGGRENETTVKSRQMVIRGHRGGDIQNVNRTNQSDLVGRKTDPRTFEGCTRGICAPRPKFFSRGMDV